MPSDTRRQRQQRVRHEAGDFVPSTKEDYNKNSSDPSSKNIVSEKNERNFDESRNSSSTSEQKYINNSEPVSKRQTKEKERRNISQKKSSETGDITKQGTKGSSKETARKSQGGQVETNVAVQEEREYEPVRIMESKSKETVETTSSLPEPPKYRRSEVISNWLQYDDLPPEEDIEEGEDYLMGEDFTHVLNLSVNKSSGGFLHLKGEMSWGNVDQSHLENHGLGALKVADLIASLDTIPLYEQLKIPTNSLPVFTVSCMKSSAEKNRSSYKPDQEYVTDIEINEKILESLKINENEPIRLNAEEPKFSETHNTMDATLKFSSAFKPEPTDVELDKFGREVISDITPQEKTSVIESLSGCDIIKTPATTVDVEDKEKVQKLNLNANVELSKVSKNEESKTSKTKGESVKNPVKQQEKKTQFNFGLAKEKGSKKIDIGKKHQKETSPDTNELREPKQIPIDLNKPLNTGKAAPVLVKESEVENLEDWLDSVLDD